MLEHLISNSHVHPPRSAHTSDFPRQPLSVSRFTYNTNRVASQYSVEKLQGDGFFAADAPSMARSNSGNKLVLLDTPAAGGTSPSKEFVSYRCLCLLGKYF